MHGMGHSERILKLALKLSRNRKINRLVLLGGAYFHGIIKKHESACRSFLKKQKLDAPTIDQIVDAAYHSLQERQTDLLEGKFLHDAHLLEGGRTFIVTKTLCTGSFKHQSLRETVGFIRKKLKNRSRVALPSSKKAYEEKLKFARAFVREMERQGLA